MKRNNDENIDITSGSRNKDLNNLIQLMDDECDFVYKNVKEKFLEYGEDSMQFLKNYIESKNELVSSRSKEIISIIHFETIDKKLERLSSREEDFLEEAIFLISSFEYPEIDFDNYKMLIDKMASDIGKKIGSDSEICLTPMEKIEMVNQYLFEEKGFRGNTENFFDPDNSYLNRVIDRKTGIPISLSILYILIAKRLGLPVSGVNLPAHFIIKYKCPEDEFFIDPYNKGKIILKNEAICFLKFLGIQEEKYETVPFLMAAKDRDIVARAINNLVNIYDKKQDREKVLQLLQMHSHF